MSPTPPDSDLVTQLAGFDTLEALSMTEPMRAPNTKVPVRGRRVDPSSAHNSGLRHLASRAWAQRFRLVIFAANGMNVFAVGLLIQVLLVRYAGMGHVSSYIAQTVASVQLSFLLSRFLTWRDRDVAFAQALAKFNLQQLLVTGLGMAGYAGLERFGVNYIAANVAVTAVLTPVSFLSSHKWSMGEQTRRRWQLSAVPWQLPAVLILQSALSIRLAWANTAFGDEALYLWAGHLEWAYWLHGGNSVARAAFPTWFSGSPVIYPPLGAIADSLGGLAGARLLSLGFMLGTTIFLYSVIVRLLDRRAAIFAALIFGTLAPTQDLGAFATYDAMALFLLAFGTWLGVFAAKRTLGVQVVLLGVSGMVLVLADATKYATTLWNPIAIVTIGTAAWQIRRFRTGLLASGVVFGGWLISLAGALAVGGHAYWQGILQTTLARSTSDASVSAVLHQSFTLIGFVLFLGLFGLLLSVGADNRIRVLCGTAVIAVLLAPINQARIHTTVSLHKHVDFGAWFCAIAAGYLAARVTKIDMRNGWYATIVAAIAVPSLLGSYGQAYSWASYWPNSSGMVAALRPVVRQDSERYLFEEFDVAYYYLHNRLYPGQISNMFGFLYWDEARRQELSGNAAFQQAIANHYYRLVEVDGQNIPASTTAVIENSLSHTRGYRLIYKHPWGPSGVTSKSHGMIEIWQLVISDGHRQ